MIVQNKYIKIKTDKEYTLHNYIYDAYLELITQKQYIKSDNSFKLNYCYIKFDDNLVDIENASPSDFDIRIAISNINLIGNVSKVECNYTYTPIYVYDIATTETTYDLSEYLDRKITAIGFGTLVDYNATILACVDTSNYSIYFKENISIERKDIFSSDALSSESYPINLAPITNKYQIVEGGVTRKFPCYTALYSIGLGTRKGVMDIEYVIGTDIDVIEESSTSFGFNLRKGLEPNKYPTPTTYAGNLYPLPLEVSREILPNINLYPGNGKYPLLSDYKYIVYKYRYYYFDEFNYDYIDLDEYFTMSLPNDTKGLFEIVTKIERSDV